MNEKALDEASAWLVRMRDESVSPEDCAEFVAWLDLSPENEAAYQQVAGAVDRVARVALTATKPQRQHLAIRVASVAAAAAAVVLITLLLPNMLDAEQVRTAVGETRSVELADGSDVIVNTGSLLDIRYSRDERRLLLQSGEAYFAVEPDIDRPFVVEALGQTVRATGTQFAVRIQNGRMFVWVVEGSVLVSGPRRSAHALAAGQQAVASGNETSVANLDRRELARATSWRSGWLTFSGQTLEEASSEVERYTGARFEFSSDEARSQLVYAHFRATDLEAFLSGIAANPAISVTRRAPQQILVDAR